MAFGSVQGQSFEVDNSKIQLDASQIVSGVLPLIRGGTGQTTIQGLKNALGITEGGGVSTIHSGTISSRKTFSVGNYKILIGASKNIEVYNTAKTNPSNYIKLTVNDGGSWSYNNIDNNVYHYLLEEFSRDGLYGIFVTINGEHQCGSFSFKIPYSGAQRAELSLVTDEPKITTLALEPASSSSGEISIYGIK